MARIIATIIEDGYVCSITEDVDGRVHFVADADIDADGANGQNGGPAAYRTDDSGSEALENGGMRIREDGKVICKANWARDVVILGADNEPRDFDGVIASKTLYKYPGYRDDDPRAYVDSESVPYIVVPPQIIFGVHGVVCGCKARVSYRGRTIDCVVADQGPSNLVGELSIAAARSLGINPSPRHGGTDTPRVQYELWPGTPAPGFELQPAY